MSRDIDGLPLYDAVVKVDRPYLSDEWVGAFASLILTLQEYLSSSGIAVPRLTTEQRDALQGVTDGRIIYNTTTNKFQGRESGSWVDFI